MISTGWPTDPTATGRQIQPIIISMAYCSLIEIEPIFPASFQSFLDSGMRLRTGSPGRVPASGRQDPRAPVRPEPNLC